MSTALDPHHLPEQLNLADVFLHRNRARFESRVLLRTADRSITYGQLADQANRACGLFRSLGLEPEQRVLLMLPDVPEFASAWFGAVQAGGVVAAVNPEQRPEEVAYYFNYTRAKIAVIHASVAPLLAQVREQCPFVRHVLVVGDATPDGEDYARALETATPDPRIAPTHRDDPAVWLFTSGSTGLPKAATHKQHDFIFNALTYGLPILQYRADDVGLSVSKLAFGYALGTNLLFPMLAGAQVVLFPEKSLPDRMLEHVQRFRPTVLTAVPTAINGMVSSPLTETTDFSSLRVCISAGEALPAELYHRWKDRTGVEILDGIGSAEMFHIFITNRFGDVKLGSLGRVVEGYEAKICDDDGRELPRGEVGTLWIRGDSMALEYWQQHQKSKETFRGEWCVSADKFRQDEDGYFYFCGRSDDLIKVSGKWLSPLEVENALLSHPAVREAAVVAYVDGDGLEKPKAFVVLKDGHRCSDALGEELKTHVHGLITGYKTPRVVEFIDALPRSDRGKVLKAQLSSKGRAS